MPAVRNIRLCTKDCLCLYVCPTGATDTETGQIDAAKCLEGCRACVDACPSHAISLLPKTYPPPQPKADAVRAALRALAVGKMEQALQADAAARAAKDPVVRQLAAALSASNRRMAEDLVREAGFLLPQSRDVIDVLQETRRREAAAGGPTDELDRLAVLLDPDRIRPV